MAEIYETDDAPSNADLTPYVMEPGDTFRGTLTSSDVDTIRIELAAETTYEIAISASGLSDVDEPRLRIWNPYNPDGSSRSGFAHPLDDDPGPGLDAVLTFTAGGAGTYYIEVSNGFLGIFEGPGDYELRLSVGDSSSAPHVATYDEIAEHLTDGYWEWSGGGRRSFDIEPGGTLDVDITALNAEGQQLARWALDAWTNVSGIDFRFVEDADAHITFDDVNSGPAGVASSSTAPGGRIVSSHVNVRADWPGTTFWPVESLVDSGILSTYIGLNPTKVRIVP